MSSYCPHCGNRINEFNAKYCSSCGSPLNNQSNSFDTPQFEKTTHKQQPYEIGTIKSLNTIAGIFCVLLAILFLIIGIFTLFVFVGIIFLVFAIINFYIKSKIDTINTLLKNGNYKKAKEEQLLITIIGFLFGGIIIGIILLIGYLKYDTIT